MEANENIIMYKVETIAKSILSLAASKKETVSHLKLQKLLYFVQGWHLACLKSSLFEEDLQAWAHGPVVPSIFDKCKTQGTMYTQIKESLFPSEEKQIKSDSSKLIEAVYLQYAQYSGTSLEFITHQHEPWKKAYTKGQNSIIEKNDLKIFFSQHYSTK